jgi:hypothetical protein
MHGVRQKRHYTTTLRNSRTTSRRIGEIRIRQRAANSNRQ